MNITYEVEQIPNGHRVTAYDNRNRMVWAKSYFRDRTNQGYAAHCKQALALAANDCQKALERARTKTFSEIVLEKPNVKNFYF